MALTPKQNQFVAEYTVDFNATAAAIRAGYSEKTAGQTAHKMLQSPQIQEAVKEAISAREARTQITGDRVLKELARIAFSDAGDYAKVVSIPPKKTGGIPIQAVALTPTAELTADQRAAIASIEETQAGIKVRTHDKVKALELLGKNLGLFTEKIAIAAIDPETVKEVEALIHDAEAGD